MISSARHSHTSLVGCLSMSAAAGSAGEKMPSQTIRRVKVDFPWEPYDVQVTYMDKVMECLDGSMNALLESPTGTGKTLSLLCSTLAWQRKNKRSKEPMKLDYEQGAKDAVSFSFPVAPQPEASGGKSATIIYASRTHAQLAQVIRELKSTSYRPRMAVLGSREQLCVHPEVSKKKGAEQNRRCSVLTKERRCRYKVNLETFHMDSGSVLDIEELGQLGHSKMVCPYYLMRQQATTADLVLMPYNYLLDAGSRTPYQINWGNSIMIFDEAHNIEGVASDALSLELTTATTARVVQELKDLLGKVLNGTAELTAPSSVKSGDSKEGPQAPTVDDFKLLIDGLLKLEDGIDHAQLVKDPSTDIVGAAQHGHSFAELLTQAGMGPLMYPKTAAAMDRILNYMLDQAAVGVLKDYNAALEMFVKAYKMVFRHGDMDAFTQSLPFYRVFIQRGKPTEKRRSSKDAGARRASSSSDQPAVEPRVLNYWCFSPGLAMEQLKALKVRSIILTSGTLNPLDSFASELRIPFPVRLENQHVIDKDQFWVGVLGVGPRGRQLCSSFQRRNDDEFQLELGETIIKVSSITPGGVLVFFPSYGVMDKCVQRWKRADVWRRLQQIKPVLEEPKTSSELKACIAMFDQYIAERGGACLLAVCRGKVSEGIDFADERARAVIITGIPYPPARDPKVDLKRKFLDQQPATDAKGTPRLRGMDWYGQQASRAVNQAVGRVIRHRHDYGAVLLLDDRFGSDQQIKSLSTWVRPHVRRCDSFDQAASELQGFFKRVGAVVVSEAGAQASQRQRVGAGHRAPRVEGDVEEEEEPEGKGTQRAGNEAVVVGAEMDDGAVYLDPRAIKEVVKTGGAITSEPQAEARLLEYRAAIKQLRDQQAVQAGGPPSAMPASLATVFSRTGSVQPTSSSSSSSGLTRSGSYPGGLGARLTGKPTLSKMLLGDSKGGGGRESEEENARKRRKLGLTGTLAIGSLLGSAKSDAQVGSQKGSVEHDENTLTRSRPGSQAQTQPNRPAAGDSKVSNEEILSWWRTAKDILKADKFAIFKSLVKEALDNKVKTQKQFQAWAHSVVGLCLETGADADFLCRFSASTLPPAFAPVFDKMLSVRRKGITFKQPLKPAGHTDLAKLTGEGSGSAPGRKKGPQAGGPPSASSSSSGHPPHAGSSAFLEFSTDDDKDNDDEVDESADEGDGEPKPEMLSQTTRTEFDVASKLKRLLKEPLETKRDGSREGEHRECSLCRECRQIYVSPCNHLACFQCWQKWLTKGNGSCPYKCGPVSIRQLKRVVHDRAVSSDSSRSSSRADASTASSSLASLIARSSSSLSQNDRLYTSPRWHLRGCL